MHVFALSGGTMTERVTDGVAILAVLTWVNPAIYAWLSDFSTLAALLLPILGCAWLVVQISIKLTKGV